MRKVSYAKLHSAFFCVGTGNLKDTLSATVYTGMELWETATGLEVHYKDTHFFIPAANIVGYVIEKEKEAPYKVVPKAQ